MEAVSADYQNAALSGHNSYRARHGVSALQWDTGLERRAQRWANNCQFAHSGSGENLAGGYPSISSAIDAWYNEATSYSYANPGFSGATGHFTQIVWKGTARVGCASAECGFGRFDVCNYDPPGNVLGQFQQNVFPPGSANPDPGGGANPGPGGGANPGPGGGQCGDSNANCGFWAAIGECQNNPGYMLTSCCASCEAAGQGEQQCTDSNANCPFWASIGECQNNPGYMLTNCCASCGGN